MRVVRLLALAVILPAASRVAGAQGRSMAPIPQSAYDDWKTIASPQLSNDGKWVVYTLTPEVGEGTLVVRSTTASTEYRQARGFIARPSLTPSGRSGFTPAAPAVSADSRWVVFTIEPARDAVEKARREKRRAAQQPKTSLGIMDLQSGQVTRIPRVKSFRVPRDQGAYVAYSLEADTAATADSTSRGALAGAAAGSPAAGADSSRRKEPGTPLVLRDLASGNEVRIPDVASFAFSDSGTALAYVVSSRSGTGDGAFVRALPAGAVTMLATGPGRYQSLTFDRAGRQIAFLSDRDEYPKPQARNGLYWATLGGAARAVVKYDGAGADMVVASNGTLRFSSGGEALFFGVGPTPIDLMPADSMTELAVFDLWHYKDQDLQPAQKVAAAQLRAPWYTAVFWPRTSQWAKLGSDSAPDIRLSDDGRVGLAISNAPYRIQGMWGEERFDLFLVDGTSGAWKPIKHGLRSTWGWGPAPSRTVQGSDVQFSPQGKYVLMFEGNQWKSYVAATGKTMSVTAAIAGVHFEDVNDDHPKAKSAWGIGGWTTGDERVLIYDQWDVWAVDPSGAKPARNLTAGIGRAKHVVFRVGRIERGDDPAIDPARPLWLTAVDDENKDSGIWTVDLAEARPPQKVVMMPKRFTVLGKAKNAEQYLVTEQTFREFPDLWTGASISSLTKVSDANPQQSQYRWGSAELVRFTSSKGVKLKATLYKPDGFDPKQKYPLLVYIYERMSQGLHDYHAPSPSSSSAFSMAQVSKGYLVVQPDIVFTDGHPGESAVAAVVPAVQSLIDSGFVDPKRVGLEGHSWGGYESAYIPTRTNIFRAVSTGAPVANMTSAYSGIRWGTGIVRAWQYEAHQSRIGATPWDRPDLYLENSPLFHLQNVKTPYLVLHNDNDGAVPWYQGVELFIGLRRLGKEAYLFDYNGDDHGIAKRANAMDWDMRMQQFFDHYLLGAARPEWMDKGIPYVNKGRNQSPVVVGPVIQP